MIETIIVGIFAVIGLGTVCYWVARVFRTAWNTLSKMEQTFTRAVDYLEAHQKEMAAAQTIADALLAQAESPNSGPLEPVHESADADGEKAPSDPERHGYSFTPPIPPYARYPVEFVEHRAKEQDAPNENVEVTGDEDELADAEKVEQLRRMGMGAPDPEFRPKAVEVSSE